MKSDSMFFRFMNAAGRFSLCLAILAAFASASLAGNFENPSKPGDKAVKNTFGYKWGLQHGWDWRQNGEAQIPVETYSFIQLDATVSVEVYTISRTSQAVTGRFQLVTTVKDKPHAVTAYYRIPYSPSKRRYDVQLIQYTGGFTLENLPSVDVEYYKTFASSVLDELANDWRTGQVGERVIWSAAGLYYGIWDGAMATAFLITEPKLAAEEVITNVPIALNNLDQCAEIMKKGVESYFASALSNPTEFGLTTGKVGGTLQSLVVGAKVGPSAWNIVKTRATVAVTRKGITLTGPNIWKLVGPAFRSNAKNSFSGTPTAEVLQQPLIAYQHYATQGGVTSSYLSPVAYLEARPKSLFFTAGLVHL